MARRRRRRRASAAPRRHRRRRRATHANPTHRRRSRRHRRRSYRRNPGRKFGLGGGKGLFGINPQTALTIAAGAAVSTVVVGRFLKSVKLPGAEGSTTRLMVNGLVGAAAAFFLGKMLKKPALGAQLALGAVVVPLGGILAAQASKFGGGTAGFGQFDDFPATTDDISGALYAAPDAVAGIGMDEDDDLSAFN